METKVYYLNVNLPIFDEKDHTELTNEEFITLAEQYGNIHSLSGFQEVLNSEEFNPVNNWVRIIEPIEYHISKSKFISWYLEDGQDSENNSIIEDIKNRMINKLLSGDSFNLTIEELFEESNQSAINLRYIEEFEDEDDRELSDINVPYILHLINKK